MKKASLNWIRRNVLCVSVVTLLLMVSAGAFTVNHVHGSTPITVYVDPANYGAQRRNETVRINVNIKNVETDSKLISAQFKLRYDPTVLEIRKEWITEGDFLKGFAPDGTVFMAEVDFADYGIVGIQILPPPGGPPWTQFPDGSGTLATFKFNAIYRPSELEPKASCNLELSDTVLLDVNVDDILHNVEHGYYEIACIPLPELTVTPDPYIATRKSEVFEINVDIERVDSDWQLIGAQFKLGYNANILEAMEVTKGPFMEEFAPYGTWFQTYVEDEYILVGILIFPNGEGVWEPPFPEGSGTLATIKFHAISEFPPYCNLDLYDTILIDVNNEDIPHNVDDGMYKILTPPAPEEVVPLQVEVDVGTTHFRGEFAEFCILITYKGTAVNATSINSLLHKPDGSIEALTTRWIAKGFYKVKYEIPGDAPTGTYALLVEARNEWLESSGSSFKCFLLSPTLTTENAVIESIEEDIATIVIPSLGAIQVNLTAINAKLVSIDGTTATIQTTLGTIKGDIATIETYIGEVKADISSIQGTQESFNIPQYATLILALIAAIGAILWIIFIRRK